MQISICHLNAPGNTWSQQVVFGIQVTPNQLFSFLIPMIDPWTGSLQIPTVPIKGTGPWIDPMGLNLIVTKSQCQTRELSLIHLPFSVSCQTIPSRVTEEPGSIGPKHSGSVIVPVSVLTLASTCKWTRVHNVKMEEKGGSNTCRSFRVNERPTVSGQEGVGHGQIKFNLGQIWHKIKKLLLANLLMHKYCWLGPKNFSEWCTVQYFKCIKIRCHQSCAWSFCLVQYFSAFLNVIISEYLSRCLPWSKQGIASRSLGDKVRSMIFIADLFFMSQESSWRTMQLVPTSFRNWNGRLLVNRGFRAKFWSRKEDGKRQKEAMRHGWIRWDPKRKESLLGHCVWTAFCS